MSAPPPTPPPQGDPRRAASGARQAVPAARRRGRDVAGAVFTLGESAVLLLVTFSVFTVPHSTQCRAASGRIKTCGAGIPTSILIPLVCAIVLFVVAMEVLRRRPWARGAAFAADLLVAAAALAGLAITYASASSDDRSTYAALWVLGLLFIAPLLVAVGLLWPSGSQTGADER